MLNYSTQKNNFNFKAICHLGKKQYATNYINQLSGQNWHIMNKGGKDKRVWNSLTFYRESPKGPVWILLQLSNWQDLNVALVLPLFQCVLTLLMAICVMHSTTDYVISKQAIHFSWSIFLPMLWERHSLQHRVSQCSCLSLWDHTVLC